MSKPSPQKSTGDWNADDVERWLRDYPLPATFKWNGTRAYPSYRLKKGFGFWLRTSGPYYPALRGLFGLCCRILIGLPVGTTLPNGEELGRLLQKYAGQQLEFTTEDLATPQKANPAEDAPSTD